MKSLVLSCLVSLLLAGWGLSADTVSFRSDIAPILRDHCVACHGAKKAEGGYRLDNFESLLQAGDSGERPIATAAEEDSELLRRVSAEDASERMPPESEPLTPGQLDQLQQWMSAGANFDGHRRDAPLSLVIPPARYAAPPEHYAWPLPITALAFSPDGRQLLVGGYHELLVWNVSNGQLERRIQNIGQRTFAIVFSSDGKTLAVACGESGKSGEVRLVDFESGEVRQVIARTSDVVLDVAFRPGQPQLAIASADNLVRIIDVETLAEVRTLASHADWVTAIAWSDDGSRLISVSRDKTAKVFDGDSGELLSTYTGHEAAVRGAMILADGKQVLSTGGDHKLHRWNIEGAKKVAEVSLGGEGYKLARDADTVFIPCADQRVRRIELAKNQLAQEYVGHSDWVLALAVDRRSSTVASGGYDGEVRLWNIDNGQLLRAWVSRPQ